MDQTRLTGQSVPRMDAGEKAAGQSRFTADMSLPRMLYGRILRSHLPHARIARLEVSRAARLPGVKAIITGRDTAGVKYGLWEVARDRFPLAMEKVRYIGDEIAAVAAVDEETAEEALGLIDLELEELPAVFDPEEALKPGAPQIHEHAAGNISQTVVADMGQVEEGFREAYHVREDTFTTQAVSHAPLETHVALAQYEPASGITMWASTQTPFYLQDDLAMTLQLPRNKVRVIKPVTGGGFGGKVSMDGLHFCAALLAMKAGRPVCIAHSREEEFLATRRRHPAIIYLRTAVDRNGLILAKYCRILLDGGAYINWGATALHLPLMHLSLPYAQKGLHYEGYRAYTNNPPAGAMRGHMSPQVHFAQDVQMDLLARDLGIDPVEIRLKNALHSGDVTVSGLSIPSSAFASGLEALATRARADVPEGPPPGRGFGCSGFPSGSTMRQRKWKGALATAMLVADADGFFTLFTGASDVGQGTETSLCQIAARELGVPLDRLRIVAADTALTPPDAGTFSSRVTMMAGNAVLDAARKVSRKLKEAAADRLEASAEDLELAEGEIYVRGSREKSLAVSEAIVACMAEQNGAPLMGQGAFDSAATGSPSFSFSSQVADVVVDPDTGQVEVSKVACTHDCGVAINPMSVEGQLEGSVHMGIGFALAEKSVMASGAVLNPSFLDYKVLTALDVPHVEVTFSEVPDPVGPLGAKEAGEGTGGPTAPAVVNAIASVTGRWITSLPVTPESLLGT